MLKIVGGLLVVLSTTVFGFLKGKEYSDRVKELQYMKKLILMLKGEVEYARTPLSEAFFHISKRCRQPFSRLFMEAGRALESLDGQSFQSIWDTQVHKELKKTALSEKDRQQLSGLGEQMGYLDSQTQAAALTLYVEQLDMEISDGYASVGDKVKLCRSLGVMSGLFFVLLML